MQFKKDEKKDFYLISKGNLCYFYHHKGEEGTEAKILISSTQKAFEDMMEKNSKWRLLRGEGWRI